MALINIFDFYNQIAEKYPESEMAFSGEIGARRSQIVADIISKEKGLLLDVGCHDGHWAPVVQDYVGLDFALPCLKRFSKPRVWADALRIPFRNGCFSTVLASEVMEHIYHHKRLLKEFNRVLKPEGKLLLSVPHGDNPWKTIYFPDFSDYGIPNREYLHGSFNEEYLQALCGSTGFSIDGFQKIKDSYILLVFAHKVKKV